MPVTVDLMGGLGNQLFQIATGYALSKRLGTEFYLSNGRFQGCGAGSQPSKYRHTLYARLPWKDCPHDTLRLKEREFAYTPFPTLEPTQNILLDGYFQSEHYFPNMRTELRALFTPADHELPCPYPELLLGKVDACFLGVRRGDYLRHPRIHNPCGMDYYTKAMRACPADVYYIASDDLPWCRQHFLGPQYVFMDIEDDLQQFFIGTLFSKYIIGNSTYNWWMSYLSVKSDPIIIAPDKWIYADKPASAHQTIYRQDMIVIERAIEVD